MLSPVCPQHTHPYPQQQSLCREESAVTAPGSALLCALISRGKGTWTEFSQSSQNKASSGACKTASFLCVTAEQGNKAAVNDLLLHQGRDSIPHQFFLFIVSEDAWVRWKGNKMNMFLMISNDTGKDTANRVAGPVRSGDWRDLWSPCPQLCVMGRQLQSVLFNVSSAQPSGYL